LSSITAAKSTRLVRKTLRNSVNSVVIISRRNPLKLRRNPLKERDYRLLQEAVLLLAIGYWLLAVGF